MSAARLDRMDDVELLLASQRDPTVFCEVFDRWAQPLLGFFVRRVADPELAAELLAETMAVLFEKRDRFRDTGHPASAWIFKIAARQLSRYRRRRRVEMRAVQRLGWRIPELDYESAEAIEALAERDSCGDLLGEALHAMPSGERDAVELKVIQQLEYHEIADRLGCSITAARVRVHRGLARLHRSMEVSP